MYFFQIKDFIRSIGLKETSSEAKAVRADPEDGGAHRESRKDKKARTSHKQKKVSSVGLTEAVLYNNDVESRLLSLREKAYKKPVVGMDYEEAWFDQV